MMHIMTENGWRPFYDPSPLWEARHKRLAEARQRIADFDARFSMRDIGDSGSLNVFRNSLYRRLSSAQDAMLGG